MIRHLQGRINGIDLMGVELHWNSISNQLILKSIPSNLALLFQTMMNFLFPSSFITLTMSSNNSTCLVDEKFHRVITISFTDGNTRTREILLLLLVFPWKIRLYFDLLGSQVIMLENAEKNSLHINGSYPEETKFEKERISPETIVQIDVGTLVILSRRRKAAWRVNL